MTARFSVIIPTYNRTQLVRSVVEGVVQQTDESFEILVIDNGDKEPLDFSKEELADFKRVTLLRSAPGSTSRAKNLGINTAKGEWCIFLDDDCFPVDGYGKILSQRLPKLPPDSYLLGRVLPKWLEAPPMKILKSSTALDYLSIFDPKVDSGYWKVDSGLNAAMAVRKKDLVSVGCFREDLGRQGYIFLISNEETDLQNSLQKKGVKPFFEPDFAVKHLMEPSRVNYAWLRRRAFWQGVSDSLVMKGNLKKQDLNIADQYSLGDFSKLQIADLFSLPLDGQRLNENLKLFRILGFQISAEKSEGNSPNPPDNFSKAAQLAKTVVSKNLIIEFSDTHPQNASLFFKQLSDTQAFIIDLNAWDWSSNSALFVTEFLGNLPPFVENVVFSSLDPLMIQDAIDFQPLIANPNIKYHGVIHAGTPELIANLTKMKSHFRTICTHSEVGAQELRNFGILQSKSLGFFSTSSHKAENSTEANRFTIGMIGEFRAEKTYAYTINVLEKFVQYFPKEVDKIVVLMFGVDRDKITRSIERKLKELGIEVRNESVKPQDESTIKIKNSDFFKSFDSIDCVASPYGESSFIYVSGPAMHAVMLGQYVLHDPNSRIGKEIHGNYGNHSITNPEELELAISNKIRDKGRVCSHLNLNGEVANRFRTLLNETRMNAG